MGAYNTGVKNPPLASCEMHGTIYKVLLQTFKRLYGLAPPYIDDLLKPHEPERDLRSADQNLLEVPKTISTAQQAISTPNPVVELLYRCAVRSVQAIVLPQSLGPSCGTNSRGHCDLPHPSGLSRSSSKHICFTVFTRLQGHLQEFRTGYAHRSASTRGARPLEGGGWVLGACFPRKF